MLIIILSMDNVYMHVSTAYQKSKAHYDYITLPLNFQSQDLSHQNIIIYFSPNNSVTVDNYHYIHVDLPMAFVYSTYSG